MNYAGYLLTYFTRDDSAAHFAISRDGRNFNALGGGKRIAGSDAGTHMIRDPFTIRLNDGTYRLLGTDNWSSTSIVVLESDDMVTWQNCHLAKLEVPGATFAWAPECMFDTKCNAYRVYFSADGVQGVHKMYSALTCDFEHFGVPQEFIDPGEGYYAIDGTVLPYGDDLLLFYKHSLPDMTGNGIWRAHCECFVHDWEQESGALTELDVEGPTAFKDNGAEKWYMYVDPLHEDHWQLYTSSAPDGEWRREPDDSFAIPQGAKHGNIMPITEAELMRLEKAFG